ncbi:MAG: acetyl-CoA C-acyltransferase [Candidatus Eremiobacteraeota bacterium]|nr:acetyl-CoA C-acyltransferase [Candidatus Eremiobacteraeota bacterium]
MTSKTVVLASARTPFGRLGGALSALAATTLGGEAIRAAVERSAIDPAEVEHVIMGQVLQGGAGQAPARQALYKAGLAKTTTFETLNKVCASGMMAVVHGTRLLNDDGASVVVAGGMESMSSAPYALHNARFGYRFGDGALLDLMSYDGLLDPFSGLTMAQAQSKVNDDLKITREVQDEFAFRSQQRAAAATEQGLFKDEIVPLKVATKAKGKLVVETVPTPARARIPVHAGGNGAASRLWDHDPTAELTPDPKLYSPYITGDVPFTLVERDEPIRADATLASMQKLPPLDKGGTITAGNAPGVNDGAAALVLSTQEYARSHGYEALGQIVDHAAASWDPAYLALTPAMAAQKLLDKNGLRASQIDVWEVNEAFAAVAWSTANLLGIDPEKINALGGAVALGHPIGASGARITASVVHQLRRRGGGLGIAAICSGGGQGDAVLVKVG